MDNRNMYQQTQQPSGYYPYSMYPAATASYMRTEMPAYMMPQTAAPAGLKGRPVSSFEEARVAQIDLDGSISIFPDLGNKKIYTKRINTDGTAAIQTYTLDIEPVNEQPTYVTREEYAELRSSLDEVLGTLKSLTNTPKAAPAASSKPTQALNF